MSKKSRSRKAQSRGFRKTQPKGFWTATHIVLIGSALVLATVIASAFFRNTAEVPKPPANVPSKPGSTAAPMTVASGAPSNPAAPTALTAAIMETPFSTLNGKPRRLADYAGKVVVVDIWATWCGPCRIEVPHLVELAKEFKGHGVEVIGLTTEDPTKDAEKVREFAKQFKINYTIGWANGEFALGLMQGRSAIPQTYVIGRNGQVRKHFVGFNAQSGPPQLRAAIEQAIVSAN